jgi:hypothetical protein
VIVERGFAEQFFVHKGLGISKGLMSGLSERHLRRNGDMSRDTAPLLLHPRNKLEQKRPVGALLTADGCV